MIRKRLSDMSDVKYQFSATLLDSFEGWLHPDKVYDEYWGAMDEPSKTFEDFCKEQEQSLLNHINKVEFVSEAASKGTAFNDLIDYLITDHNADVKTNITPLYEGTDSEPTAYECQLDGFFFKFPSWIAFELANLYGKGSDNRALPQYFTEGVLDTAYGKVNIHGYIDELMPMKVHDIKTTSSYKFGKFKNHWQHLVYLFCLNQQGNKIDSFQYDVVVWKKNYSKKASRSIECNVDSVFYEEYLYRPEEAEMRLKAQCEALIEFIEANKDKITNEKIFNYRKV